jgi:hypothetical protein
MESDEEREDEGSEDRRATVAVMTMARDEAEMMPRWADYYGGQVGRANLFVLDDNTSDGSTDDLGCSVLRLPEFDRFEGRRMKMVSYFARTLLQVYETVIFTDVDEFLLPDPARHDGLLSYLQARPGGSEIASLALNVVHAEPWEAPLDPSRPVLGQRRFAKFAPVMCKPAVNRSGARWIAASHGVRAPYRVDPELFMVHLKFADSDHLQRVARRRSALALRDGRGSKATWLKDEEDMRQLLGALAAELPSSPDAVPVFDPAAVDLEDLVVHTDNGYRAPREGQLVGLKQRPWVRIPERLHGLM